MEQYTDFASVYDSFMDDAPYDKWCDNIVNELANFDIRDGLVLELGCGTGSMTQLLASRGYDMIGIDSSQDMLNVAYEKKERSGYDILYLNQDMREFELYGTVRAVVSVCDSVNYLLEDEEVIECFHLVNNYLDNDGIFIFDFNTAYKYREVIGDSVIAENREQCSFIWENLYDTDENINEYFLTVFARTESGLYRKFEELHYQRGYLIDEMRSFIEASGMKFIRAYDADTLSEVRNDSERIYCVASKG